MRLAEAVVDRYGPLRACEPEPGDGITVVAGPNESGKTLYLEALCRQLAPDVVDYLRSAPRVTDDPIGRVVLDVDGERHEMTDEGRLGDVTPVEPAHLHNLLTVRDGDLRLPDGDEYYTSLVDHLGDIHTAEIERIREELLEAGRLTASRLDLTDSEPHDHARSQRDDAAALADDVEAYLEEMADTGVADLSRERLRTKRRLADLEADLAAQRVAKRRDALAWARDRLDAYRAATDELAERDAVDRDELDGLRELERDVERDEDDRADVVESIDAMTDQREELRASLDDLRDRKTALEQREDRVSAVETALEQYRDSPAHLRAGAGDAGQTEDGRTDDGRTDDGRTGDVPGAGAAADAAESGRAEALSLRRRVAVGGLVGGGLAAAGGAVAWSTGATGGGLAAFALAVALLAVAAGGWYSHRQLTNALETAAERRDEVVEHARDAGFDVDDPAGVPAAVNEYRDELERFRQEVSGTEATLDSVEDRIDELETERAELDDRIAEREAEIEDALAAAGVDATDEYAAVVEEKEAAAERQRDAARDLEREVVEPDATAPATRADEWERALSDRTAAVDDQADETGVPADVDASDYDEATLQRLEDDVAETRATLADLTDELDAHRDRLEGFERRLAELRVTPFVDDPIVLQARTSAGLERLADDLRDLVDAVERDAELSRKAIDVFDEIRDDEARKIETLFESGGPAAERLADLTDGRYVDVEYDAETGRLAVTTAEGGTLDVRSLSQGTQDQLYFAARLGLARQLLAADPGFLLLDDPFLAADPDRLRNGFETLDRLAADGWQVVYCTAKPEVYDGMADAFDLRVHELSQLEH